MFAEDPSVFLRDFGIPCSANGVSFLALRDLPDEVLQMAGVNVQSTMPQLTVSAADVRAAGLVSGTPLVINGQSGAVVRDVMSTDDGAFFHVPYST